MKIRCINCGKEMTGAELLGHAEAYILKTVAPALGLFFMEMLKNYLSSPKRGFFDDTMAGLANACNVICPKCKTVGSWESAAQKSKKPRTKNHNLSV